MSSLSNREGERERCYLTNSSPERETNGCLLPRVTVAIWKFKLFGNSNYLEIQTI